MTRARPYNNALREQHAEHTRQLILETGAKLLKEDPQDGLSVPKLSERSGISTATIYRYFPNRSLLLAAIDAWIGEAVGRPPYPEDLDALLAAPRSIFEYFERAYDVFRAISMSDELKERRASGTRRRDERMLHIIRSALPGVAPQRVGAVAALARSMLAFESYRLMKERFGVDAETAGELVAATLRRTIEAEKAAARRRAR